MDEFNINLSQCSDDLNFQGSQDLFQEFWKDNSGQILFDVVNDVPLSMDTLETPDGNVGQNQQTLNSNILQNLEINDQTVQIVQLPVIAPMPSVHQQGASSLPACENWPGNYDFTVSFNQQERNTKSTAWTYSTIKDKLYVAKDAPCPINFSTNAVFPNDTYIRVMALYTSPEQVAEIVERCINHSMGEMKQGRKEAQHLIRSESKSAEYCEDPITKRHSVRVPFENPGVGQEYSTYIYKFACFGSCAGGPNRRPLMLIFTLERNNEVIGRRRLDVKICACPGRDRQSDEAQIQQQQEAPQPHNVIPVPRNVTKRKRDAAGDVHLAEIMAFTKNVFLPPEKKCKVTPNKEGAYGLFTNDKDCYDFLKQMKKFFELCKFVGSSNNGTSSQPQPKTKTEKKP